jgi:hypothetical protein
VDSSWPVFPRIGQAVNADRWDAFGATAQEPLSVFVPGRRRLRSCGMD